ncbi:MAG: Clp1/GlmU family protein [Actinomycetota bacterium]|nr:polynucleotide 5'-hydroxyl-kinase [Actinomycetota bacterium]
MDAFETVIARIVEKGGMAVALGGMDTGKTTFVKMCAAVAMRVGKSVAILDTDVGQSTIGPPTTIGLRFLSSEADLEPESLARADAIYFVGDTTPQGHLLPQVVGTAKLAQQARESGAEIILVDTTGLIGGTLGQVLKFHKLEVLRPDIVVGFQRGGELEPILGIARRSLPVEVESLPVPESVRATNFDDRITNRQARLKEVFAPPVHRWKVKASVFLPQLPPDIDPASLDGMLVGMEDGKGVCIGIGILEYREESLRMISTVAEGAKALRLGSTRVTSEFLTTRVDLRELFVSD